MSPNVRARLVDITSIPLWDNPWKYLGIPAKWGGSKVQDLTWIKERVLAKMEGWKGSILSQVGKEVLIKAIV